MKTTKHILLIWMIFSSTIGKAQMFHELKGLDTLDNNDGVNALCADNSGNVYAAGNFMNSMGNRYVAIWNKVTGIWSELGGDNSLAANDNFMALCADSSGNIYASGSFTNSKGKYYVARWNSNNNTWSELGGNNGLKANSSINSMCMDSKGNLYATGGFTDTLGFYYVAKWNKMTDTWSELDGIGLNAHLVINVICTDGNDNIYAAPAYYDTLNAITRFYVSKWDGTKWTQLGTNTSLHNWNISTLCTDTAGNVYAAGSIYDSSGMFVAQWNGRTWSEFAGSGSLNPQNTTSICFDKTGNLYAAYFGQIAKWNITSGKWETFSFPNTIGLGRIVVDNNNNIYIGGRINDNNIYRPYVVKFSYPSPSLSIDLKDTSSCSFTIDVPVRGNSFHEVSKLSGSIGWDTRFLNFGGIKFAKNGIVLDSSKFDFTNTINGKLGFNWSDNSGHTIADSAPVFTIVFYPHPNFSGGTGVWFDTIPNKLEIDTTIGIGALKAMYNDGWVLLSDTPQIVQASNILQCYAGCVPIHYQWYYEGNPITGDTLNYINADSIGAYSCIVTYISGKRVSSLPIHIILPVVIKSFNVQNVSEVQGLNTLVSWETTSEVNVWHFNLQRSLDGISFITVSTIQAKGVGNYFFYDTPLWESSGLYYRLEIVDKDGRKTYSEIKELSIVNYQLSIVPNPAKDYITIAGKNIMQVILLDNAGRLLIKKNMMSSSDMIKLDIKALSTGIYFAQIKNVNGSIKTEKIVKY